MTKVGAWDVAELASGPSFCVKPWVHCHVTTSGDVRACAISRVHFGNLKQNTLTEIWDDEPIRHFRAAHLSGQKVAGCERCYILEDVGAPSLRKEANLRFAARALEWVRTTDEAGRAPHARPIDYDIRFSNICNFKCRSCHHAASSSWYLDQIALNGHADGRKAIIRAFETPADFWSAFDGFIDDVEELYFAGGEPLLQDEHYQVLEALHRRKRFDVLISYNTNFSVLGHRGVDVTKLWRDFRSVHVAASLDGSGARAELLRHGQSWRTVLAHRERLRSECSHVKFWVACAVSVLNVWHVPDFHRELIETGFIAAEDFEINIVQEPLHMSAQVLSVELKREVEAKITRHADWLRERGEPGIAERFGAIVRYLWAGDSSASIPVLREVCQKLDALRGEKTVDVFPELSRMMS